MNETAGAIDLNAPGTVRDPYPLYAHVRSQPGLTLDVQGEWLVSRFEDVRAVLTDAARFAAPPNRLNPRATTVAEFSRTAAERHRDAVEAAVTAALDRIHPGRPTEVLAIIRSFTDDAIARVVPRQDGPADDFVRSAAVETLPGLLGNAALAFARHPKQWHALRRSPALLASAVEECLRYDPPTQYVVRTALQPCTIAGTGLQPGNRVLALVASANRDEAAFPGASTFDIERQPARHLAFGAGDHYCIGANIARFVCEVFLGALVDRFDTVAVDPASLEYRPGLSVRALEHMTVEFSPAHR